MSVSFNWEFEERDPEETGPTGKDPRPSRRHWLFWAALLLALLVGGGLLARGWVNSRLDAVEKAEEELGDFVELELKSIADGDEELFRALQDPIDAQWQTRQVARYISNSGPFVPAPGLTPADRPPEIDQVHVFGDSGRAELTHWFHPTGEPDPSPLPFHITWFYRLDEDGVWHHVAPPEDYWGVPYTWFGTRLVIRATETEARLLDPIARELAGLVVRGCRRLQCPKGRRYTLSFDGDLGPRFLGQRWTLPAPHLAGLPENEAAEAAWVEALKQWMSEALVRSQAGGPDPRERVLYRGLLARFQAELGLAPPPAPDVPLLSQALAEGRQHTLEELWAARYDSEAPEEMRLLEAEVTALLGWVEAQVGTGRLFELVPALGDYYRLDTALMALYQLAPPDFEGAWLGQLVDLTGVTPSAMLGRGDAGPLEPPPPLPRLSAPPGDQIAAVCNQRVWVGDADGHALASITSPRVNVQGLSWSPDGRWLLTSWIHHQAPENEFGLQARVPYLLEADGSADRFLIDDPALIASPGGWSPDGREIYYDTLRLDATGNTEYEHRALDIESGATRQLPGLPYWSPDGSHLVYVTAEPSESWRGTLWLADSDWEAERPITDRAQGWQREIWAPSGERFALVLQDGETDELSITTYDLTTERFTPLVTAGELLSVALSWDGPVVTDGSDRSILENQTVNNLSVYGWSADGSRILVLGHWRRGNLSDQRAAILAVVPLDGATPRVLALGKWGFGAAGWSPVQPERLAFAWATRPLPYMEANTYLFDLRGGPIYTATHSVGGTWSPDGAWVAFPGQDGVTVVDQGGQARFALLGGRPCSAVAWNPTANLGDLGRPVSLSLASATPEWEFSETRTHYDTFNRTLHVWGQVTNHTGAPQRIVAFIPLLQDNSFQRVTFLPLYRQLIQTVDLADGRSLPFGFSAQLWEGVRLEEMPEIRLHVAPAPSAPGRDDLDVLSDTFDLAQWPDAFAVSGAWENPGPELSEYLAVVVTAYDTQGLVMGWGWRYETAPAFLTAGRHDFTVPVELFETVAELDLELGSYKVQLFGR